MQNTEDVVLESYAEGSASEHASQFADFYKSIHEFVYDERVNKHHASSPSGHCVNFGSPTSYSESTPITPDCKTPEGCLFCENYAIHSDDGDIRKLLSLRYIINETAPLAHSEQHHLEVFGGVLKRISELLDAISQKSNKLNLLINEITEDVEFNENLDPYWEKKLTMLCDIGAL